MIVYQWKDWWDYAIRQFIQTGSPRTFRRDRVRKAAEQLGIPYYTLADWRYIRKHQGASYFVGSGYKRKPVDEKDCRIQELGKPDKDAVLSAAIQTPSYLQIYLRSNASMGNCTFHRSSTALMGKSYRVLTYYNTVRIYTPNPSGFPPVEYRRILLDEAITA